MSDKLWKQRERQVAKELFGGLRRNPLSGANNSDDKGNPRLGDILYEPALVEVKLRAHNAVLERARETQKKAEGANPPRPWIHLESQKGDRKLFAMVLPQREFMFVIRALREFWGGPLAGLLPGEVNGVKEILKDLTGYCLCGGHACDRCREAQNLLKCLGAWEPPPKEE